MKKLFLILMILWCGVANAQEKEIEKAQDYWVYVRLEDRSGVTTADDAGRSKAGDVVAVLPVSPQHIPSETEKKEWMIYKASLTETQRDEMLMPWVETETKTETISIPKEVYEDTAKKEEYLASLRAVSVTSATEGTKNYSVSAVVEYENNIAYRKNKLDTSALGVKVEKGLVPTKIDASKISVDVKTTADLSRYEAKRKFYAYVQRPLKIVANKIIKPAFAETVSTCNKSGENYNTITLWEDAVDGDLVTNTSQPTAHVYNDDGTLTDKVTIDGSTTSSSYYLKVTVPSSERHGGVAGVGAHMHSTDEYTGNFYIADDYTVIEWMELTRTQASPGATPGYRMIYVQAKYATIQYNILHDSYSANSGIDAIGFHDNIASSNQTIINNIIYDIDGSGINSGQYNAVTFYIYNNTIYNASGTGIVCDGGGATSGSYTIVNNIIMENGTDTSGTIDTNTDNLLTGATVNFVSTTDDAQDFHLATGSTDAVDQGTDLSGTFTLDIDAVARSGTWDIGADEYVVAGGSTYYPFKKFNHGINVGVF